MSNIEQIKQVGTDTWTAFKAASDALGKTKALDTGLDSLSKITPVTIDGTLLQKKLRKAFKLAKLQIATQGVEQAGAELVAALNGLQVSVEAATAVANSNPLLKIEQKTNEFNDVVDAAAKLKEAIDSDDPEAILAAAQKTFVEVGELLNE